MKQLKQMKDFIVGEPVSIDYVHAEAFSETAEESQKNVWLAERISEVTQRAKEFSSNEGFWSKLLRLIEMARVEASEDKWIAVEQYVIQAEVLVNRAIGSQALKNMRVRLAIAPAFWFVALFLLERLIQYLYVIYPSMYLLPGDYFQYLWAGMVGGTTIVWWGIVKHAKDLTFDPAFLFYYFLKPALGAVMGIMVVLIIKAGFFALQGDFDIQQEIPLIVVAFLGGFSERFFVQLIDRVITAIFGGESTAAKATESPSQPLTPPKKPQ